MAKQGKNRFDHHRGSRPLLRRTKPLRAGIFLTVNLAGFAVVCAFWRYVSTGKWIDFSPAAFLGDLGAPLGQIFLRPLDVLSHPWMILINGLLLGLVVFTPIIVSVLYRLGFAVVFVLMVALLGHAPVLALTLAISIIIAARTPLRSDMPFLAVLLALVPVALYLYIFGIASGDSVAVPPLQRWALYAPFVVALVAAVAASATVLAMARLTGYRPGVVLPVLAVLLSVPLGLFYWQVGVDELRYALLSDGLVGGDTLLAPQSLDDFRRDQQAPHQSDQQLLALAEQWLAARRNEIIRQSDDFLQRHGESPRAPEVAWLRAQARSLVIDRPAFEAGLLRASAAWPVRKSRADWLVLTSGYPTSPQAILAAWRLGQLALAADRPQEALERLTSSHRSLAELSAQRAGRDADQSVMSRLHTVPSDSYYAHATFETAKLLWLMRKNNILVDEPTAEAMASYFRLNPHSMTPGAYRQALDDLASRYETTYFGDNLLLAYALARPDPYERAQDLLVLASADNDAAVEANFALGRLTLRKAEAPVIELLPELQPPAYYFRHVSDRPFYNPWAQPAREHLERLGAPQLQPTTATAPAQGSPP
jgi:hypothetical protein